MSRIDVTKSIDVIIYSYKGKSLKDVVENLIDKSSGVHDINVIIFDQYPLIRDDVFGPIRQCIYRHIFWDHITSPCKHKSNSIKTSFANYTMIISDTVMLKTNWDLDLINFVGNKNIIVSGKGKTSISHNGIYYLSRASEESDSFILDNWIDRDFIFGQSKTVKSIEYPDYLKYNGEEEVLSMSYFANGIDTYSAPSDFYYNTGINSIMTTYHTFSKDHNYNECVSLIKSGQNKYIDLNNLARSINEFLSIHNISKDYIKPLPFLLNDVDYDPHTMVFDKVDSKKFMTKVNYIA